MNHNKFFVDLPLGIWAEVSLEETAKKFVVSGKKLLLEELVDPLVQIEMMEELHALLGCNYSWGGYMEDRVMLFSHHYHAPGHTVHLGVDYNVPQGTKVTVPVTAKLAFSRHDSDQYGGWGGQLFFEWNGIYFILAHLRNIVNEIGRVYYPGEVVGEIAGPELNGGWFPHLHVQCMRKLDTATWRALDGYSHHYDGILHDFPCPYILYEQDSK